MSKFLNVLAIPAKEARRIETGKVSGREPTAAEADDISEAIRERTTSTTIRIDAINRFATYPRVTDYVLMEVVGGDTMLLLADAAQVIRAIYIAATSPRAVIMVDDPTADAAKE